jgi:hypothetical protein
MEMLHRHRRPGEAARVQRLLQRWGVVLHLYRLLGWSPPLVKAWAQFA